MSIKSIPQWCITPRSVPFQHVITIDTGQSFKHGAGVVIGIAGFAEFIVSVDVELVSVHEALLLGLESAIEVALKSWLRRCLEEEKVGKAEVEWCDKEANGLHHVPAKFPESEPHEPKGLDHQEAKSAIELHSDQGFGFVIYYCLLFLHLL